MYISKIAMFLHFIVGAGCLSSAISVAQDTPKPAHASEAKPPHIHVVYFGGNDCPPCVAFRGLEFPKLEKSPAYSKLEWTFVAKTIRSPVPSAIFLPDKIKPLRDKLLDATGGISGSAQVVILVDNEVYDVFSGSQDAKFYEQMVASVLNKEPYPTERCIKRTARRVCGQKA
jgi:hypothetical protein